MTGAAGRGVVLRALRSQRRTLVASTVAALGWQLVGVLVPVVLGWVVAAAIEDGSVDLIWYGGAAIALLAVAEAAFDAWRHHTENEASARSGALLREDLAAVVLAGPTTVDDPGDLVARGTNDVGEVAGLVDSLGYGASFVLTVPVVAVALVIVDPVIGAFATAAALLCLLVVVLSSTVWERRSERLQEAVAASVGEVQAMLSGLEAVHGLGAEAEALRRYEVRSALVSTRARGMARLWIGFEPLLGIAAASAAAIALWVGGDAVRSGQLGMGELVTVVGLAIYLVTPVRGVGEQVIILRAALASAGRIAEVAPAPAVGQPLSLDPRPGEVVWLTGPGADSAARSYAAGRQGAVLVDASPYVFGGTLAENLRLAAPAAAAADLERVARTADVDEYADRLGGLDLDAGERGSRLSGGQRQRLALARALLTDPDVLVLDQALSGLEPSRQERILRRLAADPARALVVVSDHPVLPTLADRRVVT